MFSNSIGRVALSGLFAFAIAAAAHADPAPITFAGQGASAPVQTASLAGGGDNSYGYGAERRRSGATIDIRRSEGDTPRAQRAPFEINVAQDADDEDEAPAQSAAPQRTLAQAAPAQRPEWLEQERVGPPYEANGRWYVPTPEPGYEQTGTASWYGADFQGQRTASGETFDQAALTAAHPTLPIPSLVQVTNLENGREVIVRVNDRGPFVGERLIDMSRGAAEVLGFDQAGHARVHVRYLGPAPRRVDAEEGARPAPVAPPAPARSARAANDGPLSLTPEQGSGDDALAGAPMGEPVRRPTAPSYAAATQSNFFVQVGAFSDLGNAHRVRDAVGQAGPVVVDVRTTASGGELFRVRVGPWTSREEADAARRTLASLGYGETVIASR
ncbi:septal ring lytic transglycosylase RlpA family protein [Vitreimonas flagellata]|uniref:septal ring lytic transglycosylase RlpA family protein n=1 Tax=Vitreimonas flagellata TaxID=2560861 RepID=UPI001430914E|nr:septal ring lytic transglycosylase RlpA family protein [Vitreimonas flagellata]